MQQDKNKSYAMSSYESLNQGLRGNGSWAQIHKKELSALWEVIQTDEEYFKIKGLE